MKPTAAPASHGRQRGAAAVELGILLVPLVVLVFGISEYGRAIQNYNKIVKSACDAVRYLTQFPGTNTATDAHIVAAKNLVVYGNAGGTGPALVDGLTTAKVDWCDSIRCASTHLTQSSTSGGVTVTVNLVTVTVSGVVFTSLVPAYAAGLTFGPISATMGQVL